MSSKAITAFSAFWPFYLGEHRVRLTRTLHFIGSSIAIAGVIAALVTRTFWLVPMPVIQGYAWAWVSHFFVEKNKPASFGYPLWSFISDFKMLWYFVTGRLDKELQKYGVQSLEKGHAATITHRAP